MSRKEENRREETFESVDGEEFCVEGTLVRTRGHRRQIATPSSNQSKATAQSE